MESMENMDRIKKNTTQFGVQSAKKPLYYINVTDPLIILMIFIFLPCCEKTHDKKKISQRIQS